MKFVYYWSPFISKVATIRSVINSAKSLKRYSKNDFEPIILNVAGEWNFFKKKMKIHNIKIIDLTTSKILDEKNWTGFIKSRLVYFYVFIRCFLPTLRFLVKKKPDFLIIHLITSLPLIINYFFNIKTNIILRISGMPKLNFLREVLWRKMSKKLFLITSPSVGTLNDLSKKTYFKDKLKILYDPVINPSEIFKKKNEPCNLEKDYFISIGRFTKQKNFEFLISSLDKINLKGKNFKLFIFGEGELKDRLNNLILKFNLQNNVKIFPFQKNIYKYLVNSKGLILTSLWEDPGFVIIEAAYLNVPIFSSNCKNGPEEILGYGSNGVLYKNKDKNSFIEKFNYFLNLNENKLKNFKINSKKQVRQFTSFRHHNQLINILKTNV